MNSRDVAEVLKQIDSTTGADECARILMRHSNLPGPRGNLELAHAFASRFRGAMRPFQWDMLVDWATMSAESAPTGDPQEYLCFCAVLALGEHYIDAPPLARQTIFGFIKTSASDSRWRMREACAMALQRIAEKDFVIVRDTFELWLTEATLLEMRAILAALAHPPILTPQTVQFCLSVSAEVLKHILALEASGRKSEDFRVLRRGLEYVLSVFVEKAPDAGFGFLREWSGMGDPDIGRVIKSNLGKARLKRHHAAQVSELRRSME